MKKFQISKEMIVTGVRSLLRAGWTWYTKLQSRTAGWVIVDFGLNCIMKWDLGEGTWGLADSWAPMHTRAPM